MNDLIKQFNDLDETLKSLWFFMELSNFDEATIAPKNSGKERGIAMSKLSKIYYEKLVNDENKKLFEELDKLTGIDELTLGRINFVKREYQKTSLVPMDEYSQYAGLLVNANAVWEDAKESGDYSTFAPYLDKIIKYNKKYIEYKGYKDHPYNALLDDYEAGMTVAQCDAFFEKLKAKIVPLLKEITEKGEKIEANIFNKNYDIKGQEKIGNKLMQILNYDLNRGILKESVHPFTMSLSKNDVRITTHYYEDNILSSIYSTIHETGHALYDQNVSDELGFSLAAAGAYMGIHESQSRLHENNIGRSREFWGILAPILKETYPESAERFDPEKCYKESNIVTPSLIRIEADELTYALHVLVRYEIEKEIFTRDIDVMELPKLWNDKYEEYLGIRPTNDSEGILQDIHWAGGSFGYFPTYALGSAYACQYVAKMEEKIGFTTLVAKGDLLPIREWLTEKIHKYGATKKPAWLIKNSTGEDFNPDYFIDYLDKKYRDIYGI